MANTSFPSDQLLTILLLLVAAAIIAGTFAYRFARNTQFKKRLLALSYVVGAAVLVLFLALFHAPAVAFVLFVPSLILIAFLQFRMTHFCDTCNRSVIQRSPFRQFTFCPYCGAKYSDSREDP